ncbi:MAG: TrkH family potassium uptake protein [Erysipelotrichaceae bacterium]|nr:TrkH family potassium uptake protein [Erysipelotrichaceae bacterium]
MKKLRHIREVIKPTQILAIGFFTVILTGALLLMLPISTNSGHLSFLDAFFTATSATCVTGLVVVDTGTYFTFFGQVIIILLIQLGGLGFMTVATFLFIASGKRISLKERMTMAESLGESQLQGVLKLALNILKVTFLVEFLGALLLAIRFIPTYGTATGIWYSVFHSISAFCNAGFDLIGRYMSFTGYVSDPLLSLTIMALIIIGGLGFGVVMELFRKKNLRNLRVHSKIILTMTVVLILGGTVLFLLFEYSNPLTLGKLPFWDKVLAASFQSVTTRTAGFNSIDQLAMHDSSKLLSVMLMFIGGSPAGTAGGIKTSTIAVLFLITKALIKNRSDVEAYGKRLGNSILRKALAIFLIGLTALIVAVIIISINEQNTLVGQSGFLNQLFEAVSAIGTVGLSTGITGNASDLTLIVLCILMFMGRVGLLTIAFAFGSKSEESYLKYPEEDILVG